MKKLRVTGAFFASNVAYHKYNGLDINNAGEVTWSKYWQLGIGGSATYIIYLKHPYYRLLVDNLLNIPIVPKSSMIYRIEERIND